jgi:serine/threonine protein kinase
MVYTSPRITVSPENRIKLAIDAFDNIITVNGIDYELKYLGDLPGNRGGNSNVFKMQMVDDQDQEGNEAMEYIIKISKIPLNTTYSAYNENRKGRFRREILALKMANRKRLSNVVKIIDDGAIRVGGKEFLFYTMEKASSDLTDYLRLRRSVQQKILLFQSILEGVKQLHSIDIYHRDIKHDNIFMFDNECKIGDLGLIRYRHEDNLALDKDQRIGAFGWETPEAMNKFLTENVEDPEFTFDCKIDECSDIFQLGKLFWYILQGNLPIGYLDIQDFRIDDPELYDLLLVLLQHGKDNGDNGGRPLKISAIEELLQPIVKRYAVS